MTTRRIAQIFNKDNLSEIFPEDRSDQFFEALFGDPAEGAYDISLEFRECTQQELAFEFHLKERTGKCLACNLTSGLPQVFARHPVINIDGIVKDIDRLLDGRSKCTGWTLGNTRRVAAKLHVIPFVVSLH